MKNRSLKTVPNHTSATCSIPESAGSLFPVRIVFIGGILFALLLATIAAMGFSRSAAAESVATNTVVYDISYEAKSGEETITVFSVRMTDKATGQGLYVTKVRFHNHEEVRDCTRDTRNHYDHTANKNSAGLYEIKFNDKYKKLCILVELKEGGKRVFYSDFHDLRVGVVVLDDQSAQENTDPSSSPTTSQAGSTNSGPTSAEATVNKTTCDDLTDPNSCQALRTIDAMLNFLALLVMPIATIMIIIGGIQYSMAGDNSDSIKNAKAKIFKAVLALISFAALWSFLKWLIPGGLE